MHLNRIFSLPSDPFISHMRIAWQDNIRKETEEYWTEQFVIRLKQRLIDEMCPSPSDEPCDICGGLELALTIINDEFGV